ncbi:MAG: hypothetical protein ACFFKA_21750 [Candidatus Thorarchaeota archaeon]
MCEFKIIKKNTGSQILEDIVILSYTEDNELLFRDVIGMGETLNSALIVDVNTLNQIKDFPSDRPTAFENFQHQF